MGADNGAYGFCLGADGGVYQLFESGVRLGFGGGSCVFRAVGKGSFSLGIQMRTFDDEYLCGGCSLGCPRGCPFRQLPEYGGGFVQVGRQFYDDVCFVEL